MPTLTEGELHRLLASLHRRYLKPPAAEAFGLVGARIGAAFKGGQLDAGRPQAVRFEVRKKIKQVRAPRRSLPKEVRFRLKEGGHYRTLTLPTDVVEVSDIIPSGRAIATPLVGGSDEAVAGVVVTWQQVTDGVAAPVWAVLTVGHACGDPDLLGGSAPVIIEALAGGVTFSGTLVAKTEAGGMDLALIKVSAPNLTQDGIGLIPFQPVVPLDSLFAAPVRTGVTLNPRLLSLEADLQILDAPQSSKLGVLGVKQRVVEATSSVADAFAPKSSGSVWMVEDGAGDLVAGFMQLATQDKNFHIGYGQVLDQTVLASAEGLAVEATFPFTVVPGSFQFVRGF